LDQAREPSFDVVVVEALDRLSRDMEDLAGIHKRLSFLAGLENEMRHPLVIAEYVRTYHEERKRLSAKANAKRAHLELRLGELNREIDRLVDAIAKGHGNPAVLGPRSSVLNEERKQVTMELNLEPASNDAISLHPAVLARYQEQLVELQDALSKGINAGDSDGTEAIRGLVETVTVFRDPSRRGASRL
jgi:hypothetical protein